MKDLKDILIGTEVLELKGSQDIQVERLCFDSRMAKEGDCFFAQRGVKFDGHNFIDQVISQGSQLVICQDLPTELLPSVTYIKVEDTGLAMAQMANKFYDEPSSDLKLVGVTGTNGKTTCVSLLHQLYSKLGHKSGLLSTVVNKIGAEEIPATHTTPDSIRINELLRKMVDAGCSHCFMEVSSHAVVQHRIAALHFTGGVFTNITHEHLDYHKTFKSYIEAKRQFFNALSAESFALSNKDDKNGEVMLQETKASKFYYSLKSLSDFKTKLIESNFDGLSLKMDGEEFWSPMIGHFNAYNLTAVYGCARLLGEDKLDVLTALSSLRSVAGRFQYIKMHEVIGIVDYAHSPDALENVLKTIKNIRSGNETVITVVGCGGDRDRSKRPMMASIACQWSDRLILTSDNPRTEDPAAIIEEMKAGVDAASKRKVLAIVDRKEAIRTACSLAQPRDILLIAGKGHETYQEINGVRQHFDDVEVLANALNELKNTEV